MVYADEQIPPKVHLDVAHTGLAVSQGLKQLIIF
jgi:hypothetical protein